MGVKTDPRTGDYRNFDAAKRFADTIALHQTVLSRDELIAKRYIAVALSDGSTDGVVYDTRNDAMRHQKGHPALYLYFQIPFERLSVHACDSLLWYVRGVYDAGYRPRLEEAELVIPNSIEDIEEYANDARRRHGR